MVSRVWGNYFKDGTVKKRFEELDGYVRARLRSFRVKRRTWRSFCIRFRNPNLREWVWSRLVHYLNSPS
ncbi:MAG: hypothetical protein K8R25_13790, partial [Methanosarcinales archaeon]|nr:hypothetical protein [Methanosarcinales archaeon]